MSWDPIRKIRVRRPLMLFALCLAVGMAIGYQNAVLWPVWAAGLTASALLGILRKRSVFLFSSALLLGAMLITLALIKPSVAPQDDVLLTGRIASEPDITEARTRILLDSAASNGNPLPSRVMLYLYGEDLPPLEYGAALSVQADLYLPSGVDNPYGYDYSAYLWRQGAALAGSASVKTLTVTAPAGFSLTGLSLKCRAYLQSVVNSLYSNEVSPLVSALLLGDRSLLPDELYASFKTAGLAHLLAISGLHISCLAAALDYILRRLRCPDRLTLLLVTLFLLAYASIVGFPASICRAVLMYVLSAGARLFGRPADGLTGLSLALIVLLLADPLNIADVSLILSFSSVAGLLILTRLLTPARLTVLPDRLRAPAYWLMTALAASLSAQLGSLPAVACLFGTLSTYSLLSNLPALPLMTAALPVAMLSVFAACFCLPLGRLLAFPVEWALKLLSAFTNWVAALPGATIDTPVWSAALILAYLLLCVLASSASNIRRRFKQLLVCLLPLLAASALLLPATYPTTDLEVLFLDAGQADAAVIRAEDQYYLMDVGEDGTMADYLAASGIRPSAIFLSHPHADHAGGLAEVVELCDPAVIYLPCRWNDVEADEGVPALLSSAEAAGWTIRTLEAGDTLNLSDCVLATVHQPWPDMTGDGNGASLCMSVRIGEASVLFTGDLPTEDEYALFPDCDVLKVAHHGAKSSTSSLFLKMTSPSAAIVSVGHNSYGHPAPETLARLQKAGTSVFRTDECGAISALLHPNGDVIITPMRTASESEEAS